MSIQIIDNFEVKVQKPIDNRFVVGPTASGSFYRYRYDIVNPYTGLRIWDLNDGQPYVYNGSTWSSEASLTTLQGTGATNYLPIFTSSNSLASSEIYQTSGNILIGTTSMFPFVPTGKLQVNGVIRSLSGGFYGIGTNLLNLNASNITTGSLSLSRISLSGSSGFVMVRDSSTALWTSPSDLTVGTSSVSQNIVVSNTNSGAQHHLIFSSVTTGSTLARVSNDGSGGFIVDPSKRQLLMPPYYQVPPEPYVPTFAAYGKDNPPYSFAGDPNTGMFSPGADRLAFSTGGTARIVVSNSTTILNNILRIYEGTEVLPGLSFGIETGTGIYRSATNFINFGIASNEIFYLRRTGGGTHVAGLVSAGGLSTMTIGVSNVGVMSFNNQSGSSKYTFNISSTEIFSAASDGMSMISSLPTNTFQKTITADKWVADFTSGTTGLNSSSTNLASELFDRIVFVYHGSTGTGGAIIETETTPGTFISMARINESNGYASCMGIIPAGKQFRIKLVRVSGSPPFTINIYKFGK